VYDVMKKFTFAISSHDEFFCTLYDRAMFLVSRCAILCSSVEGLTLSVS